jgi:RNA polymerase sigma factor (sigma-70 family)
VQPTADTKPDTKPDTEPDIDADPLPDRGQPDTFEPVTFEPVTFEEYVATRGPALIRFASRLTGSQHRAEDLVQDALAKAYQRWESIQRKDQPDVYLRRVLVNAAKSWWRPRRNQEVPVDEPVGPLAIHGRDAGQDAGRDHGRGFGPGFSRDFSAESAERDEMWRLIGTLPARQRAVLVLRYYEDLDDTTIAAILDCSPATVRTHAMRALTLLRSHFELNSDANSDANADANADLNSGATDERP